MRYNNSAVAKFTTNEIHGADAESTGNLNIDTDNVNNTEDARHINTNDESAGANDSDSGIDIFHIEALLNAASKTLAEHTDRNGNTDWKVIVEKFRDLYHDKVDDFRETLMEDLGRNDNFARNNSEVAQELDDASETSSENYGNQENSSADEAPQVDMQMSDYGKAENTGMEMESEVSEDADMASESEVAQELDDASETSSENYGNEENSSADEAPQVDMQMSDYGKAENTGMEMESEVSENVDMASESEVAQELDDASKTSSENYGNQENSSADEAPQVDMQMSDYGTKAENTGMEMESEVSEDVDMASEPDSTEQSQSAEDTTIDIFSTGAEPIENPNIPADTDDGDDIEKLDFDTQYTDPNNVGTRTYTGTSGANTFQAEALLNAKPEIIAKHVDNDGKINWQGVAGENDNRHDHWVEGPGEIKIDNFGEGDKFVLRGHTSEAILLEESDGVATIGLISDQGNDGSRGNGAHDLDVLGKATIYHDGSFNFGEDVTDITQGVFDGVSEFA